MIATPDSTRQNQVLMFENLLVWATLGMQPMGSGPVAQPPSNLGAALAGLLQDPENSKGYACRGSDGEQQITGRRRNEIEPLFQSGDGGEGGRSWSRGGGELLKFIC